MQANLAFAAKTLPITTISGSYELCVARGLKDAESPVATYLIDPPSFDPAHADPVSSFAIPAELPIKAESPDGR